MANDWIKMRCDLFTHPKVVRISSALKADTLRTVGGLMSAWCLFDAHSIDGRMSGYSPETLDSHLRWEGFSVAMISVGWLFHDSETLYLPNFETHNGASAKRRAQDSDRKKEVRKTSAEEADKKRTREEKRREEKKERKDITFSTFLASVSDDQDAIPEDHHVFTYADKVGIPREFLSLAWVYFERYYGTGAGKSKKYTDWPGHFRTSVEAGYGKLWAIAQDGTYYLTTAGKQLQMEASSDR